MVSKRILSVLTLLIFMAGTSFAQKKSPDEPWFFIQLTDPQFGMFENNNGFEKETILYEKAVDKINKLKPDFVIITGDFVHNSESAAQINEFKRITAKINPETPVYFTPGNHDLGQTPDKESMRRYKKIYGSDKFSFIHKGSAFIGFNSSLIKARLAIPEQKQYKWLGKKLYKSQDSQHIIMFCHYPFFIKSFDELTTYSNIDPDYRIKYLDLFKNNNVEAVFSGHYHNNNLATYGKTRMVTTSSMGKPLGTAPSGMRIVKVYPNGIEHDYFGLEELPDTVKF